LRVGHQGVRVFQVHARTLARSAAHAGRTRAIQA
jgi:hypothetical protein